MGFKARKRIVFERCTCCHELLCNDSTHNICQRLRNVNLCQECVKSGDLIEEIIAANTAIDRERKRHKAELDNLERRFQELLWANGQLRRVLGDITYHKLMEKR